MNERINIFKITDVLISSLIGIIGGYFLQLNSFTTFKDWAIAVIIFVIAATAIFLIHFGIINYLQDNSSFVRRWFSKHYIEGEWVQIIYDDNLKQMPPTKYSLVKIFMENGMIKICGSSYNQNRDGDQMTYFMSKHSTLVDDVLTYYYSFDTRESREKNDWFGRCRFTFSRYNNKWCLNKYEGEVHSNIRKEPILVRAIKVNRRMKINVKTEDGRKNIDELIKNAF